MTLKPKTYTFLCGCFVALGSMLFGYDLGVIAGVLPAKDFIRVMGNPDKDYVGFISSSLTLGAFVACIPASLLADRFSRRSTIFVGSIIFLLGGCLQTAAKNREMMLAGRFFAGLAIGVLSMMAPLYQSEIAHPSIRGRLTTLQQFFLGIGATIASFVIFGISETQADTPFEWRFPLGLQMLPCLPLAAMIFFMPESPRWLMMVGRERESLETLARLHSSGDLDDALVRAEFSEMKSALIKESKEETGWMSLVTDAQNFRKLMLGITIQFSVQMTGVSCIQYYAPAIFEEIGFDKRMTFLFQSVNSIIALIGEAACVLYIDRLGRRGPLIFSNVISGSTFAVGTAIQAKYPASAKNTSASYAFVMMTWIFNFFFSAGIGPLGWAYPVEIFNTSIRAKATSITSMSSWISNFLIGQVSPKAFDSLGWKYYILFAIFGFTNAITIWAFFPETKGRTLEEMDEYFEKTHWIVPLSDYKPKLSRDDREEELRRGVLHQGITDETEVRVVQKQEKQEEEEEEEKKKGDLDPDYSLGISTSIA
ncbi:general substrate transporter [Violaceomyces palustris]|uniref:General substrate transporter n=1 Tax=Violaceomyces palustris TaxID=1673888 RepID=A0ACD0NQF4_9BASI|nr:general substrate transporter [Violaceomyces palustris]